MTKAFVKTFLFLVLSTGTLAEAKVSNKKLSEFSGICHKMNRRYKNYVQQCECEKLNFRWLLDDKDWEATKTIYSARTDKEKIQITEELEALDTLIFEVRTACEKKSSYIAPKAKELIKKSKK